MIYCKESRPFYDLNHMNRALIENWNERVQPDDTVYHLGDFALGNKAGWPGFRRALNGRIILVKGNHDRGKEFMLQCGIDEVHESLELELGGFKVRMQHIPSRNPAQYGCDYLLVGHVHEKWANQGSMINVGVDVRNCRPSTFEELIAGIPPATWLDYSDVKPDDHDYVEDYVPFSHVKKEKP